MFRLIACSTAFLLAASACQDSSQARSKNDPGGKMACAFQVGPAWSPPDRKSYEDLKLHLETFQPSPDKTRPDDFQPAAVLPRLNPWFMKNLCKIQWDNQNVYVVAPIPDQVIQEITAAAGSEAKNGIGILNTQFWRDLQKIQAQGLQVGFLEFSPEFEVSGVYQADEKFIGFDLFAGPGTPTHEFRHHAQHLALLNPRRSSAMNRGCALQVGRFLGELDATTVQLPTWINAFDSVQSSELVSAPAPVLRTYPQVSILGANLGYPALAAKWIEGQDCPSELVTAVQNIAAKTDAVNVQISGLAFRLIGAQGNIYRATLSIKENCPVDEPAPSPLCTLAQERAKKWVVEAESLKKTINDGLAAEAAIRAGYIKAEFNQLPSYLRRDLARTSGAFLLIMSEGK